VAHKKIPSNFLSFFQRQQQKQQKQITNYFKPDRQLKWNPKLIPKKEKKLKQMKITTYFQTVPNQPKVFYANVIQQR
jgi:hypothetical protein